MKKEKGITLIALVVTIVVLLILAAVSINLVMGENGVLNRAEQATEATRVAEITDAIKMYNASNFISRYTKNSSTTNLKDYLKSQNLIKDSEFNSSDNTITIGSTTIDPEELLTTPTTPSNPPEEVKTWTWITKADAGTINNGDVIKHKSGEEFYVIGKNSTDLTLLAKYNLTIEYAVFSATSQTSIEGRKFAQDTTGGNNSCNYMTPYYGAGEYPSSYNTTAKVTDNYAKQMGGSGRLMTISEASTLLTSMNDIICGTNSPSGYLSYWLDGVQGLSGKYKYVDDACDIYGGGDSFGIRPVVTIKLSDI